MISHESIQAILAAARIEDVVGDAVTLRRSGSNLKGLCPFHNEKTPSFMVSPAKNIYKCFGCGKGGDPLGFLMELDGLSYPEALRALAKRYHIEIEESARSEEVDAQRQLMDSLYILNEYAQQYFQRQLFDTDMGRSVALSYFRGRGFSEETMRRFGLGFTTGQRDAFTLTATNAGHKADLLQKAGLSTANGSDFFRERVMFAIHNLSGKVVGFAGRIMQKDAKAPKYINSPETEVYNKSKTLYGAFFAKKSIRQLDECIMVEGYTDVISLHQAGIENVVASSGTSLTEGQIGLIKRFTPNLTFLYDGDAAGIKAALRGLDLVLAQDMNVRLVVLPDGEDPDSYIQRVGPAAFRDYLAGHRQDFILFKTELLLKDAAQDPIRKAEVVRSIVESVAAVPDHIKRDVFIRACASRLGVDEGALLAEMNKILVKNAKKERAEQLSPAERQQADADMLDNLERRAAQGQPAPSAPPALDDAFQEKDLVRLLVEFGERPMPGQGAHSVAAFLLANVEDTLSVFDNPLYAKVIADVLARLHAGAAISRDYLLGHPDQEIRKVCLAVLTEKADYEGEYSPNWEARFDSPMETQALPSANFGPDSISAINHFKLRKVQKLYKQNLARIQALGSQSEEAGQLMKLLMVQQHLQAIRSALAKETGTIIL